MTFHLGVMSFINEIDESLKKLSIRNQKCDNLDTKGDMIPMCQPCFASGTKTENKIKESVKHKKISKLFIHVL